MRLNHDCVRDVLLAIEAESDMTHAIQASSFASLDELKKYDVKDVVYTILTLRNHGFIEALPTDRPTAIGPEPLVKYLTFEGHAFLDNIRDNKVWTGLKKKLVAGMSSISVTVLAELAKSHVTEIASMLLSE